MPVQLAASRPVWSLGIAELETALRTAPAGLSHAEAKRRLEQFGANRLPESRRRPLLLRLADQLLHVMALLLWWSTTHALTLAYEELEREDRRARREQERYPSP